MLLVPVLAAATPRVLTDLSPHFVDCTFPSEVSESATVSLVFGRRLQTGNYALVVSYQKAAQQERVAQLRNDHFGIAAAGNRSTNNESSGQAGLGGFGGFSGLGGLDRLGDSGSSEGVDTGAFAGSSNQSGSRNLFGAFSDGVNLGRLNRSENQTSADNAGSNGFRTDLFNRSGNRDDADSGGRDGFRTDLFNRIQSGGSGDGSNQFNSNASSSEEGILGPTFSTTEPGIFGPVPQLSEYWGRGSD